MHFLLSLVGENQAVNQKFHENLIRYNKLYFFCKYCFATFAWRRKRQCDVIDISKMIVDEMRIGLLLYLRGVQINVSSPRHTNCNTNDIVIFHDSSTTWYFEDFLKKCLLHTYKASGKNKCCWEAYREFC